MRIEWLEKYMAYAERMIYENHVEDGLRVLTDLLYEEPGYGNLHNHLGWAYLYYTEDNAKAELHLKMAIAFDPLFPAPYLHLGTLYVRSGRYTDALGYLEQGSVKPNANRVAFMDAIGQAYELRCEYGKAITAYKEAMRASVVTFEMNNLFEGIKRCRRKRLAFFFTI